MNGQEGEFVTIIDDTWKAPLYSVEPTLAFLRSARAERKIILFGSLSDYPAKSGQLYRKVARQALEVADSVAFVGRWASRDAFSTAGAVDPEAECWLDSMAPNLLDLARLGETCKEFRNEK